MAANAEQFRNRPPMFFVESKQPTRPRRFVLDMDFYPPKEEFIYALIMACDTQKSRENCQKYKDEIDFLKSLGCTTLYVHADPALSEARICDDRLLVPCAETWEQLPKKVYSAFRYVRERGAIGVLKLDDDFRVLNKGLFTKEWLYLLTTDYAAFDLAPHANDFITTYHLGKCSTNQQPIVLEAGDYAGGPGYWVSGRFLQNMTTADYAGRLFEDHATGQAARRLKIPCINTHFRQRGIVDWD